MPRFGNVRLRASRRCLHRDKCRVSGDHAERLGEQCFAGFHAMPGRRAGGVGQGNEIKGMLAIADPELLADALIEAAVGNELFDGEFADGNDEFGLENIQFLFEPGAAVGDFITRRNAVAAGFFFAGETTADRSHVNTVTKTRFVQPGGFLEPFEQGFASRPCEGTAHDRFLVAGGLADEEDFAEDGSAADDWLVHVRAQSAGAQLLDVKGEQASESGRRRLRHGA